MSVNRFRELLINTHPTITSETTELHPILLLLDKHIADEKATYEQTRDTDILNFGKYRGSRVADVFKLEKGPAYLKWLSIQQWCTPEANRGFFDAYNALITQEQKSV